MQCKRPLCENEAIHGQAYCSRQCAPLGSYGLSPKEYDTEIKRQEGQRKALETIRRKEKMKMRVKMQPVKALRLSSVLFAICIDPCNLKKWQTKDLVTVRERLALILNLLDQEVIARQSKNES